MTARPSLGALAGIVISLISLHGATAHADGVVSGTVALADPAARGERPERGRGFVARATGPLKSPRAFDPTPWLIVVLEGGPVADTARQPPREPVRYAIIGESFASPVLPIVKGGSVELKNEGKSSPRIHAPAQQDLVPADPIPPKGARVIKKLDLAYQALELRDRDSAHFVGWVVGFPHAYFARIDEAGRFKIEGVPPGEWTARLWYRDGWLAGVAEKVTVVGGRESQIKLAVPAKLATEGT